MCLMYLDIERESRRDSLEEQSEDFIQRVIG